MDRKKFFKTLFGVSAAAVVAPAILTQEKKDWPTQLKEAGAEEWSINPRRLEPTLIPVDRIDMAMSYNGKLSPEEIIRIWEETGIYIYTT